MSKIFRHMLGCEKNLNKTTLHVLLVNCNQCMFGSTREVAALPNKWRVDSANTEV